LALFCTTGLVAQNVYDVYPERVVGEKAKKQVVTGFTGGMKVHLGYAFAQSPDELFRNSTLANTQLRVNGIVVGLGGELRVHMLNHIHLGAEGGMSEMPLAKNGSNIRTAWGGVLCDYYFTIGKVQFLFGGTIGGGSSKRLYVPDNNETVMSENETAYNASYVKTPFFMVDPYVGVEIKLNKRMNLIFNLDYMLPFGANSGLKISDAVSWSNFLSPSGPRLYIGVLFGKFDNRD